MTVGSLFSGIGGLDLGLERAGHRVLWQVESNAFCRRILAQHWPNVPCYGDITTLTGHDLAPVDLICGGFPCQPVSQAGQRKGTDDERWLWPEFARLIRVLRPRYALLENVPGLLTTDDGHAFQNILTDLAECGYDAEWDCLPAAAVGAPHLRYRVFLIAYLAADATINGRRPGRSRRSPSERSGKPEHTLQTLADTVHPRLEGYRREHKLGKTSNQESSPRSRQRAGSRFFDAPIGGTWEPEPDVGRVAHGVPHRVDRLKALGNAVVPQVAEWIGRRLNDAS